MSEILGLINKELDSLRPAMEADGGGVELISFTDNIVTVRLKGTCIVCPSANLTLSIGIESSLKKKFPFISKVVNII